jgi:hypothetical protein
MGSPPPPLPSLTRPPATAGFVAPDPIDLFTAALEEATRERTLEDLRLTPRGQ